jgi:maltose 6'-phosphate phosphatase
LAAEKGDIDVILLQEVVGGFLSGTLNSSLDLWYLLAVRGLHYNLSYRLANGLPNLFFSVGNAILTRCQILGTLSRSLPFVTEEVSDNIKILLRRNVMMSAIFVPGFGMINLFNTHLCAFCSPEDRLKQAQVMIDFIEAVEEALMPGEYPAVLGGDFNTAEASSVYESITTGFGFVDTYAAVKSCSNCCSDPYDPGCTYGVPGYPYAVNPFTGEVEDTVRIDYIFTKGEGFNAAESEVVFNINPNWVSDHSGVLTKISLTR